MNGSGSSKFPRLHSPVEHEASCFTLRKTLHREEISNGWCSARRDLESCKIHFKSSENTPHGAIETLNQTLLVHHWWTYKTHKEVKSSVEEEAQKLSAARIHFPFDVLLSLQLFFGLVLGSHTLKKVRPVLPFLWVSFTSRLAFCSRVNYCPCHLISSLQDSLYASFEGNVWVSWQSLSSKPSRGEARV